MTKDKRKIENKKEMEIESGEHIRKRINEGKKTVHED
jgi:hypothetical protein